MRATIAALGAEHIAGNAFGMHPHQRHLGLVQVDADGKMLVVLVEALEAEEVSVDRTAQNGNRHLGVQRNVVVHDQTSHD
ncbi:hypothetical protein D3C79_1041300 [compost metagenome]